MKYQAIRGMSDIIPPEVASFQKLGKLRDSLHQNRAIDGSDQTGALCDFDEPGRGNRPASGGV